MIRVKNFFKVIWEMLLGTFTNFSNDRGLKLSASLAYYTVFSLAPLLILVISLASIFYGHAAVDGTIVEKITALVGKDAAAQIQEMILHVTLTGKTHLAFALGIIILIIGATSTFIEIQDSINIIWGVKIKPKRGWLKLIQDRLLSSSLIIGLGFILIASLVITGLIDALSESLGKVLPWFTVVVFRFINLGVTFIVITVLFAIIFKFLPDVKIKWKNVRMGAIFTSILFMCGQYFISYYLRLTHQGSAYGAAGSIIVILVWIYYTSVILYLGAEFTRYYADHFGIKIEPAEYAVFVLQQEVEKEGPQLPSFKDPEEVKIIKQPTVKSSKKKKN